PGRAVLEAQGVGVDLHDAQARNALPGHGGEELVGAASPDLDPDLSADGDHVELERGLGHRPERELASGAGATRGPGAGKVGRDRAGRVRFVAAARGGDQCPGQERCEPRNARNPHRSLRGMNGGVLHNFLITVERVKRNHGGAQRVRPPDPATGAELYQGGANGYIEHPASSTPVPQERMSRIIAIANQKGGVGKTTTAINLGACLAVAERRTLVVDMDPQGNATSGLGVDRSAITASIYEVLVDGVPLADARIRKVHFPYLDV